MNRSMKQMLSALLVVAMVAALLVVPSVAADNKTDGTYRLTEDTTPVTVKVGESANVVKAEYKVSADTYAVVADTQVVYEVADDTVATAAVKNGVVVVTGVKAGETTVKVSVKDTAVQATYTVKVETAAPTTGIFTLDVAAEVEAQKLKVEELAADAESVGTDGFFTIMKHPTGTGALIEQVKKAVDFGDGFTSDKCFKSGGGITVNPSKPEIARNVTFTTGAESVVKVWWTSGSNGAMLTLKDAEGNDTFKEAEGHDSGSTPIVTTIENVPAGTFYLGGSKTVRIYKVEVNINNTPVPVTLTGKYTFDATKIAVADKTNVAVTNDLVKAATTVTTTDTTPVDGMFTVDGTVTTKWEAEGFAGAVEVAKQEKGKVIFTIPEGNKATVTVGVSSTNTTNESAYALKKDGAVVANDGDQVTFVKGNTKTEIVYTDLPAGTYEIVSPTDADRSRGMRVWSVEVNFGGAVEPPVDPQPPVEPEKTVYTITADTKVTVTVDSTKSVNVTVDPAGEVYAVSADTKIATATVSNGKVVIKGVKAGSTTVTLGVVDGIGSAEIAVTVNAKSTGGNGGGSGRPSRPGTTDQPTGLPFADVKADDWFFASVQKAYEKGLMKGTSESTFAPNDKTTRAMVATVLFRLDGEKKTDVAGLFEDVVADTWYTDAVAWAAEKGIVKGYDEKTFAPNDNVTREQLVVMLYRYAAVTEKSEKDLSAFTDAASVSEWATEAMTWAVEKGIILGRGNGQLDPQGLATRAEICTVLVRFLDQK